jgi:hypothetical protein
MKMKKLHFIFFVCLWSNLYAQNIKISGRDFILDNKKFVPYSMNYKVNYTFIDEGNFFLSPEHSYNNTNDFECNDISSCSQQLQADFNFLSWVQF